MLSGDHPWDVEGFDVADDGSLLAYFTNEEGFGKLHLLETASGREMPAPELPQGVADSLAFRPGSREVAFRLSWARSPSDVYSYDPEARRLDRWTESEVGGLDASRFAVPELVRFPTFDETAPGTRRTIPAWVYRPSAERFPGPRPVLVSIHGGPEGQSRPGFQSANNYLIDEKGIVVIFPNVRGSTGYGKTYGGLDNATKREDSVKDIGALLDWIATQPDLDASRVMVSGGSYGGYMVLASLVHYSDRLCCASESVGISDFTTFLENTQEYRRDLRRAEYGDERLPEMRAFFERISPRRQAAKIRRPLVVAQGANDPRVPLSESEEIVKAVEANGAAVWYVVGKNEGHGFAKKPNVDYLQAVIFEFMERHLLAPRVAAPAAPGGSSGRVGTRERRRGPSPAPPLHAHTDAVPPLALGLEEGAVGGLVQALGVHHPGAELRHAEGAGHRDLHVAVAVVEDADAVAQLGGQDRRPLRRGLRRQDRELVPADPRQHLLRPHHLPRQRGHVLEQEVAAQVAVAVVDLLEFVEVEEDQRQRPPVAHGARELALDLLVVLPLVPDLGQAVARHQVVDRLVVGGLDVLLVEELEVDGRGLEAVAALEHRPPVDEAAVDVGAVGAPQVLEGDERPHVAQAGVPARQRHDLGEGDRHRARAADLEGGAGGDAVARAEPPALRVGDEDDVGLDPRPLRAGSAAPASARCRSGSDRSPPDRTRCRSRPCPGRGVFPRSTRCLRCPPSSWCCES